MTYVIAGLGLGEFWADVLSTFITVFIILIVFILLILLFIKHEREREAIRRSYDSDMLALEQAEANRRALIRDRIHYLEPLARKGDLIAFQEWKYLTGNHDVVDIGRMPDITFTGVMVEW
jgi:hypothetical protein